LHRSTPDAERAAPRSTGAWPQRDRASCDLPALPVEEVEAAVERHYSCLQLSETEADRLRQLIQRALELRASFSEDEHRRQEKRSALGLHAEVVEKARADGFATVLRVPLRADVARGDVEDHLVESLVPRLLLFLTGIEELELQGTRADFVSVIGREQHDQHDEVLLETNGAMEHWLVYRRWHEVARELVEPIGDAWAQVERVQTAVAVPLDGEGRPTTETLFPLHVYFPTEEATGMPVIVHGDFALQLDRRQLGTSPEAMPYNEWLGAATAAFVADVVAPGLAVRYPNDIAAVAAVAQRVAKELAFACKARSLRHTFIIRRLFYGL
jgi:hypothetical protein